jgi:enamine deaminase RidA (YjgF/YER057c/UK114 family)
VPAVRFEDVVYTAGQLPLVDGTLRAVGKVGADVSVDEAVDCARIAALNALAAVVDLTGDLDVIRRIIKVVVYVASASGFTDQPLVANGASRLLADIFGDAGRHARSAVGVAVLPLDAPVELELLVSVGSTPTIVPL